MKRTLYTDRATNCRVMRIRFAKFSPIPSRLARIMLPDDSGANRGEGCGSCKVTWASRRRRSTGGGGGGKEGESAVEGSGTWAHVVFSLGEGPSFAVVSDSVVNEARVGFLSHPKTMCRAAPTVVSLPSVRPARSPCFVLLSAALRPLPVFCIRYRIRTTSVPVVFATGLLSAVPRGCPSLVIVVKRTRNGRPRSLRKIAVPLKTPTNP